jgi:hypothetical protein
LPESLDCPGFAGDVDAVVRPGKDEELALESRAYDGDARGQDRAPITASGMKRGLRAPCRSWVDDYGVVWILIFRIYLPLSSNGLENI